MRDVCAGDEQHQRHGAAQQQKRVAKMHHLSRWHQLRAKPEAIPVSHVETVADRVQLALRRLSGSGATVRGLVVNRFAGRGIRVEGGGGHTIAGNRIGTDRTGRTAEANGLSGLGITSPGNTMVWLSIATWPPSVTSDGVKERPMSGCSSANVTRLGRIDAVCTEAASPRGGSSVISDVA